MAFSPLPSSSSSSSYSLTPSSSLLSDFAPPPFSLLPLPRPQSEELFSFTPVLPLFREFSHRIVAAYNTGQKRDSNGSINLSSTSSIESMSQSSNSLPHSLSSSSSLFPSSDSECSATLLKSAAGVSCITTDNSEHLKEIEDSRLSSSKAIQVTATLKSLLIRLRLKRKKKLAACIEPPIPPIQIPVATEEYLHSASLILGLSWGCSARQIWDVNCSRQGWERGNRSERYTLEQIDQERIEVNDTCTRKLDEEDTDRHVPEFKRWSSFYQAYSRGQLDLSYTPPIPKGVPDFECCPMATPAYNGPLDAPTPEWEPLRARAYARLELRRLSSEDLASIEEKVVSCGIALQVQQSVLHCIEGDVVLRLTGKGFQQEQRSRQESLCAHVLLNRNEGLTIHNLNKDWRFISMQEGEEKERQLCYYTGMPILTASGLPIAVLSIWDTDPDYDLEPRLLKQTAREVGEIFEEHYRRNWENKTCKMTVSVEQMPRRFQKGARLPRIESQIGMKQTGREELSTQASSYQVGWSACYNPCNLEALADMGMFVSLEDVERLQFALSEMASLLEMESIYLAAVSLSQTKRSKGKVFLLANHNCPTERLSYRFHQVFFGKESSELRFILGQNDCQVYSKQIEELQPLEGVPPFEAMLVLPMARRHKLGFVLGALSYSKNKVIGIEDLQYMEALRSTICGAIDKFQEAFKSIQSEAVLYSNDEDKSLPGTSIEILNSSTNLGKKSRSFSSLRHQISCLPVSQSRPRNSRAKTFSSTLRVSTSLEVREWLNI